jgi:hypothetical protein
MVAGETSWTFGVSVAWDLYRMSFQVPLHLFGTAEETLHPRPLSLCRKRGEPGLLFHVHRFPRIDTLHGLLLHRITECLKRAFFTLIA